MSKKIPQKQSQKITHSGRLYLYHIPQRIDISNIYGTQDQKPDGKRGKGHESVPEGQYSNNLSNKNNDIIV